jgi:hypothetical protein
MDRQDEQDVKQERQRAGLNCVRGKGVDESDFAES